jgi:pimeloyl-ACP methyl ester carboxylesterase
MARFVFIPGAGGVAWYWHRVVPLLEAAHHDAVAVDLPGDDERAGLGAYAERVVAAIGAKSRGVVLVAQSLGGFTAPIVCSRASVEQLVFVNAMIPMPGETAGDWWGNTGSEAARTEAARRAGYSAEFDLTTYFLHDVPPDVVAQGKGQQRAEAKIVFTEPCRFDAWPELPMHVIAGKDDRFFPLEFQRRLALERLGLPLDELPGGHLIALSNPSALVDKLLGYLQQG